MGLNHKDDCIILLMSILLVSSIFFPFGEIDIYGKFLLHKISYYVMIPILISCSELQHWSGRKLFGPP